MSRQINFPEEQTHKKSFEMGVLLFCLACIVFVVICVNVVAGGDWAVVTG